MQEGVDVQAALTASLTALFSEQPIRFERLAEHIALCAQFDLKYEIYRAWRVWCSQRPTDQHAWTNAAITALNARLPGEALFCGMQLLSLEPLDPQFELDTLRVMTAASPFSSAVDQSGISNVSRRYSAVITRRASELRIPRSSRREASAGRLRLGYLWSFFGVGTEFCFPFHHDRQQFEVIAVTPREPPFHKEFIGVDSVIPFDLNDVEAANATIRAANLDLLVVLDGRGGHPMIDLLVETRPAPVQAYFGNFFASTFSPAVDFLIGDRVLIDELRRGSGNERLIEITEAIMPVRNPAFVAHDSIERMPPRPRQFRLGTTGNTFKLSADLMDLIAKILLRIPDASFYYGTFHSYEDCASVRQQLLSRGVAPDSLELYPWIHGDYTSMINSIDLAIDAVPYNGHLSSYEFLSLGTPVWSLRGDRLTQRYGEMILGAVGQKHRVFDSADDLVDTLAREIHLKTAEESRALKARVAESKLGDPVRATRLFEAALREALTPPLSR